MYSYAANSQSAGFAPAPTMSSYGTPSHMPSSPSQPPNYAQAAAPWLAPSAPSQTTASRQAPPQQSHAMRTSQWRVAASGEQPAALQHARGMHPSTSAAALTTTTTTPGAGEVNEVMFYVVVPNASGEMSVRPVYGPASAMASVAASMAAGVSIRGPAPSAGASQPMLFGGSLGGGVHGLTRPGAPEQGAMLFSNTPGGGGPRMSVPSFASLSNVSSSSAQAQATAMMPLSQLSSANAQALWQSNTLSAMAMNPVHTNDANNKTNTNTGTPNTHTQLLREGMGQPMAMPGQATAPHQRGGVGGTRRVQPPPHQPRGSGDAEAVGGVAKKAAAEAAAVAKKKKYNGVQYVVGHVYEGYVKRYNPLRGFGFLTATHELVPATTTTTSAAADELNRSSDDVAASLDDKSTSSPLTQNSPLLSSKAVSTRSPTAGRRSDDPGLSSEEATGSDPSRDGHPSNSDHGSQSEVTHVYHHHGAHRHPTPSEDHQTDSAEIASQSFTVCLSGGETVSVHRERAFVGDIFVHQSYVHMRGFRALPVGGRVRFEIGFLDGQRSLQAIDVRLLDGTADGSKHTTPDPSGTKMAHATTTTTPCEYMRKGESIAAPKQSASTTKPVHTVDVPSNVMPKPAPQDSPRPCGFAFSVDMPTALMSTGTPASQVSENDSWLRTEELLNALTCD